jgi:GDP-4-dehydro-6-deoxy-D-mannose reductase
VNDTHHVVLVTGAGGFAGSHLVEHLLGAANHRSGEGASTRHEIVGWTRQTVDLLDRDRVRAAIRDLRPAQIFHCAGVPHVAESWRDTAQPLEGNVLATEHLLDALRRERIRCRVLVPGSATVYAPSARPLSETDPVAPASPYAISKLAQEQLALRAIQEDGLDIVVTRSFNHTGPRQTPAFVAPSMARQIALIERGRLEPVIKVGNLDAQRDLTDVRDIVRAYAALMQSGETGVIYNVASGVARPIRSILDALVARSTVPVRIEIDQARMRPNDVPVVIGDATRLNRATGWHPETTFQQTLDDLLTYWRAHAAL